MTEVQPASRGTRRHGTLYSAPHISARADLPISRLGSTRAKSLVTAPSNAGVAIAVKPGAPTPAPTSRKAQDTVFDPDALPEGMRENRTHRSFWDVLAWIALLPLYVVAVAVLVIPSLVGGAIVGPRIDESDGGGTFLAGFSDVMRGGLNSLFAFVHRPIQRLNRALFYGAGKYFIDERNAEEKVLIARMHLKGNKEDIAWIRQNESNIERRMRIPGYRVDVQFIDSPDRFTNSVTVERNGWSNASRWNVFDDDKVRNAADLAMVAHEIFHNPFGLADEYNYQHHFVNKHMTFWGQVGAAVMRIAQPDPPADAESGIMANSSRRPHVRHFEKILANS